MLPQGSTPMAIGTQVLVLPQESEENEENFSGIPEIVSQ